MNPGGSAAISICVLHQLLQTRAGERNDTFTYCIWVISPEEPYHYNRVNWPSNEKFSAITASRETNHFISSAADGTQTLTNILIFQ